MAVADQILKNFAGFIDGKGYAGQIENFKPPTLNLTGEDVRVGGMDTSIFLEMGQEKMESEFHLLGYKSDILKLWGVGSGNVVQFVFRGALVNLDASVEPVNITMNGTVREMAPDQWEAGKKAGLKFTIALRSYTLTQNGAVIHDIDVLNMKRVINGVDSLAAQRAAIGL